MYIERYEIGTNTGYRFSLEKFKGKTLVSRLTAEQIVWDSAYRWTAKDYLQRDFNGMREKITKGFTKDTTINVKPEEFFITSEESSLMTNTALAKYLSRQKERGVGNIEAFENEYYKRFSMGIFKWRASPFPEPRGTIPRAASVCTNAEATSFTVPSPPTATTTSKPFSTYWRAKTVP